MRIKTISRGAVMIMMSMWYMLLATGCSKTDEGEKFVALDMVLQREYVSSAKSSQFMEIKCNVGWQITIVDIDTKQPSDWCRVATDNYAGVGSKVVSLYYDQNPTDVEREVEITVTSTRGESITVVLTQMKTGGVIPDPGENTETGPTPSIMGWLELPKPVAMDNCRFTTHFTEIQSKKVRNYSLLYDTKERIAYWVAYPHHNMHTGSSGRTNKWAYDPNFKTAEQAYMKKGISGYDRGHQIPSGDRTSDRPTNAQTFFYTNMTPQLSGLNQKIWADLEGKVREWRPSSDTLYVVTGAILKTVGGNESVKYAKDNSGQNIAIPNYYFKVLLSPSGGTAGYKSVGFWFPHKAAATSEGYFKFAKTVREIETLTGFNFFDALSKEIQDQVETSFNRSEWSGL